MATNSKATENIGLQVNMEDTDKSDRQFAKLKEKENAELKQKRPAVAAAELDASSSQKQMKLSSETSDDMDATKMDNIGEKIITKPKSVPNPNCLHDILAWIKRKDMAKSALSTSSRRFQQLCWPKLHGNVKPHIVQPLKFQAVEDESGNSRTELLIKKSSLRIPIPSALPPNYITGFDEISIWTLNGQVMKFMECVNPILNEFHLDFHPYFCKLTKEGRDNVDRLLDMLAKKIFSISLSYTPSLHAFVHSRPNANAILERVQEITTVLYEDNMDLLINWLNRSRADQPKIEFSRATHSANFLIVFKIMQGPYFVMENEQTNEVLSSESDNLNLNSTNLFRFPKGKEHLKEVYKQIKSQSNISIH